MTEIKYSRLGTGRKITPGVPFEIRAFNRRQNNYFLLPDEEGNLTLAGLLVTDGVTSAPLQMQPALVTDDRRLTAVNIVTPITAARTQEGPENLLRMDFNSLVEACALDPAEKAEALARYNQTAKEFAKENPELFGYPKQLIFNPQTTGSS